MQSVFPLSKGARSIWNQCYRIIFTHAVQRSLKVRPGTLASLAFSILFVPHLCSSCGSHLLRFLCFISGNCILMLHVAHPFPLSLAFFVIASARLKLKVNLCPGHSLVAVFDKKVPCFGVLESLCLLFAAALQWYKCLCAFTCVKLSNLSGSEGFWACLILVFACLGCWLIFLLAFSAWSRPAMKRRQLSDCLCLSDAVHVIAAFRQLDVYALS